MKFIFSFLFLFTLLSATSVDTKIKQNKKQLSAKRVEYNKMDKQLSVVAKKILNAKHEQKALNKKLSRLEKNIKNNEAAYKDLQKEDKLLSDDLQAVSQSIDAKQKKFIELVSKKFSMSLALEELNQPTSESVMMQEVYKVYEQKNNEEIEFLKKDIATLDKKKSELSLKESRIKKAINGYITQREEYQSQKKKQDKLVLELARDKAIYKKRFDKIKASRNSLEQKLAKLKIIKNDQEEAASQRAIAAENRANATRNSQSVSTIKKVPSRVTKYSGGKTISPLKGARLIKRFGTYVDPIYKFKIFNKSITLKAPHAGSKVQSVLSGKIVFAENSGGMLGKVVIVEHANHMHTIYAKLSRLAPGIHVGKQLSTGSVIGKVDNSLMFEVTKNNKHMNPMNLIRL
ncbi:peptidoglycan DD-metalloendopeptidase family protein [bacterium]|nr:peptidoglycan DD-metalloendopeptidase family protein [bacterium]MBU1958461.1 peptidoglycan DD-metalloendopeptidase family protein [bacterium]